MNSRYQDPIITSEISRTFRVSPTNVWLKEKYGGRVFFPTQDVFTFGSTEEFLHLVVEGENSIPDDSISTPSTSTGNSTPSRTYPPVIAPATGKKSNTFNMKVIQANYF